MTFIGEPMNLEIENAYHLIIEKLEGWIETAIQMLPNFLIAILVIVIFVFIGKLGKKISYRLLTKITDNYSLRKLASTIIYILIICLGTFIALSILKLEGTVTSLLAGVGIVGLALAFAFQEIASNYIAGTMMTVQKPFKVGDLIETNDYFGKVLEIHLRTTQMETLQGQIVLIPNAEVFKKPIVNYSAKGRRRIDLSFRVDYSQNLELAKEVVLTAIKNLEGVKKEDVSLYYTEFADSFINFSVRYWIPFTNKQFEYRLKMDEGIIAVRKAFEVANITIPFSIKTLNFDDPKIQATFSSKSSEKSNK